MTLPSIGDLALPTLLRTRSFEAQSEITRLTQELSTGITQNKSEAVRYDFAALAGIERSIAMTNSFRTSANDAGLFVGAAQASLGLVQTQAAETASVLTVTVNSATQTSIDAARGEIDTRFRSAVSALNQTIAGRSLFSGRTTDVAPLVDAQTILDTLEPLALASATAADWQTALDTWFGPGGDFETLAYQGDTTPLNSFVVGDTERVEMEVMANDTRIRDTLKTLASVALLDRTGFATDLGEQRLQLQTALDGALASQGELTSMRANIGSAEEAVELAQTRLSTEKTALELARNDLIAVDPYDTATRFEEANRQLESLYMITARISRLSLSDFL